MCVRMVRALKVISDICVRMVRVRYPSKHEMLSQCWANVVPASPECSGCYFRGWYLTFSSPINVTRLSTCVFVYILLKIQSINIYSYLRFVIFSDHFISLLAPLSTEYTLLHYINHTRLMPSYY